MDPTPAEKTLALWRVPRKHFGVSWDLLDNSWEYVRTFRKSLEAGVSSYLYGEYGYGKSGLAALAVKWAYSKQIAAFWCSAPNAATDRLSKEEVDGLKVWDRIIVSPLLVIDDLYVGKDGKFNDTSLEWLIRQRIDDEKLTIITSNLTPKALHEHYPAMAYGMEGSYTWISVDGKNFRREIGCGE